MILLEWNLIKNKFTTYHSKYITTQEFNKLTSEILAARLVQGNLTNKNDIANFVNRADIDNKLLIFKKRVNWNKTKNVIVESELCELPKKDEGITSKGLTKILMN